MEQFRLSIDKTKFDAKPSSEKEKRLEDYLGNPRSEAQMVSVRIAEGAGLYTQSELESAIINGQTWMPSQFAVCPQWKKRRRIADLWLGAQAIGLDFDDGTLEYEDILKILKTNNLDASIIYKTFSYKPEHPKYRVIILLEHQVIEELTYYEYLYCLTEIFNGKLDTACVDVARLFYGGNTNSLVYSSGFRANDNILRPLIGDRITATVTAKYDKSKRAPMRISGSIGELDVSDPDKALREQQEALSHLDWETRTNIANKIKQELRLLRNYKGQFGSRYQLLWNTARAMGQMGPIAVNVAYMWIWNAVADNKYYQDWDKDPHKVIMGGLEWGRNHIDEDVQDLKHIHVNGLR